MTNGTVHFAVLGIGSGNCSPNLLCQSWSWPGRSGWQAHKRLLVAAGGWWGDWRVAARPFGVCHGLRQLLRCSTGRAGYLRVYQPERHRRKRKRRGWYHEWGVDARRWDERKTSQFLGSPLGSWRSKNVSDCEGKTVKELIDDYVGCDVERIRLEHCMRQVSLQASKWIKAPAPSPQNHFLCAYVSQLGVLLGSRPHLILAGQRKIKSQTLL